ncbi:MAG: hypothetical protein ACRDE5_18735, partial [Ginsengibacter sp.]
LFNHNIFKLMALAYLSGFVLFISGILARNVLLLQTAAGLLFAAAILYNGNVVKMIVHKPEKS